MHYRSASLVAVCAIGLNFSSSPTYAQVIDAGFVQGRWTTGALVECGTSYYTWSIRGDRVVFRNPVRGVDVERIVWRNANSIVTVTERSGSEAPGSKNEYRAFGYNTVRVRNSGGELLMLTRCW